MNREDFYGLPSSKGSIGKLIETFKGPATVGVAGTVCYDDDTGPCPDKYIISELRRDRKVPYFVEGYDTISDSWVSFDYPAIFI